MWGFVVVGLFVAAVSTCLWYEFHHEDANLTYAGILATIHVQKPFQLVKYDARASNEGMIVELVVSRSRLFGQMTLLYFELDTGGKVTSTNIKDLVVFAPGVYTLQYEEKENEFYLVENTVPFGAT